MNRPPVQWVEEVASTQDAAHALAASGAPEGTAIAAVAQTEGRGSRGREWASPPGGLWLSVIARPHAPAAPQVLSVRVSLAVAEVLDGVGCTGVALKWPNDLMLRGRKLGGVLVEARWTGDALSWIVAGIGLNVANRIPPELRHRAVSLLELGNTFTPSALAEPVARAAVAATGRHGTLDATELAAFAQRDWLAGRAISGPVQGQAGGIAADGALRVRDAAGRLHLVRSGTVTVDHSPLPA